MDLMLLGNWKREFNWVGKENMQFIIFLKHEGIFCADVEEIFRN